MSHSHHKPIISLRSVGVKYPLRKRLNGEKYYHALSDISLDLYEGETLGVIGSNGAGKSTLMRVLANIIEKDSGTIYRRPHLKVMLLAIGVGFENVLTGRENAILGGLMFGMHKKAIEKRLDRIHEFSELGDFFDQPVYTYSMGMISRLGFAVAMEVNPDVLLLDEVMGVGDVHFTKKSINAMIEKIKSDMSVILISHSIDAIRSFCNRAVWIHKGVTQGSGDVQQITEQYEAFMAAIK